jgi:hypothetical protein
MMLGKSRYRAFEPAGNDGLVKSEWKQADSSPAKRRYRPTKSNGACGRVERDAKGLFGRDHYHAQGHGKGETAYDNMYLQTNAC